MIRLAADENFHFDVVMGVRQRRPELDFVRIQDAGLAGAPDPEVLAWAAREGRPLVTHDVRTMPTFAYQRVERGLPMPGVFLVQQEIAIGVAIEAILLVTYASLEGEWEGRVEFLPL